MLFVCLPAARRVARLIEGKHCAFTVAGAFFVGIMVTPALIHSGIEGQEVPTQAVTCILYIITGLAATVLFLRGRFELAFLGTMAVTQGWRLISETLRADFRGDGKFSAYQLMSVLAIFLAGALVYLLPAYATVVPNLAAGIQSVWHPALVISLQALWAVVFIVFGKSMVTGAEISFHLRHDRI
jgi:hypothetical protein